MHLHKNSTSFRILLVNNTQEDRIAFHDAFKESNLPSIITDVKQAENALEALERGKSVFDIVVTDHDLAGMTGLDLCKELLKRKTSLPLVLLTEPETVEIAAEAIECGVEDTVFKDAQNIELLPYRLEGIIKAHREKRLRIEVAEALRANEKSLCEAQQIANVGNWRWDIPSDENTWSDQTYRIFGLQPGECSPGFEDFLNFVHPDDRAYVQRANHEAIYRKKPYDLIFRIIRKDKEERIVCSKGKVFIDETEKPVRAYGTIQDITEEKRLQKELKIAMKVNEIMVEGVMITDQDGVISFVNPALTEITGYKADELIGKKPSIFKSFLHEQDFFSEMWNTLKETGKWVGEVWNRRKNGGIYPARLSINSVEDPERRITQYAAVYYDVSDIKQHEMEIKYKEYHDALTGLPNRLLFYDRLNYTINRAERNKNMFALLSIDLDNLKNINDSMGHPTGDLLLQEASARLKSCARKGDTVSRLGGDEFTIILDKIKHNEEAAACAARVIGALSEPFCYKNEMIYSSVSLGIAIYPDNGGTVEALLKNADIAMYHSKGIGKNNYHFFSESLNEDIRKRMELETALRRAISGRGMEAYYQPIYSLENNHVVGMEALARWHQAEGKVVLPADFIPLAEEKGFVVDIDKLMIQKACAFIKRIKNIPYDDLPRLENISVNLSAVDFGSLNLYKHLMETVDAFGLEPDNIGVEITESALIKDIGAAVHNLKKLRDKGFSVSIDDFGMGYSSLSYLAKLPINILKIDRSFVTDLPSDKSNNAIAKAIVFMAHELNIKVIAEGVETDDQIKFLRSIGCDQIQGYLYSSPLPENKVEELLVNTKTMTKLHLS